jgi:hypothetical protein
LTTVGTFCFCEGNPMRRTFIALVTAVLLGVVGTGTAMSVSAAADHRNRQGQPSTASAAAPAALPAGCDYRINDGFTTLTRNHFGNPAAGQVILESWGETCWSQSDPGTPDVSFTTRGIGRSILLYRALRVQMRVFLYGRGEGGWSLLDTSDSVNSAGARTLTLATDFVSNASYPNFDLFQVDVHVLIRWSDSTLSDVWLYGNPWWNPGTGPAPAGP